MQGSPKPMEKVGIKAVLSSTSIIYKWEEPPSDDLPQLANSVKNFKQSLNDYLTELVNKEKGSNEGNQTVIENSDEEEDVEDTISGFIKDAIVSEEPKMNNKRKVPTSANIPKVKKKK